MTMRKGFCDDSSEKQDSRNAHRACVVVVGTRRAVMTSLVVIVWMASCIHILLLSSCCCNGFMVLPTPTKSQRRLLPSSLISSPSLLVTSTTTAPYSRRPAPSLSSSSSTSILTRTTATATSSSSSTALFGIPKMFRWLTDQYPDILNRQLEKEGLSADLKVDAFYLDMNGIIHPCTHGNNDGGGEFIVLDETAMFKKIFLYVDRLYKLVRPSKVLYLAVDGVAPRAKMNQQRSRRFRSAAEAEMAAADAVFQKQNKHLAANRPGARRRDDAAAAAMMIPAEFQGGKRFDSNCITPGTDFMLKLSLAMQKWVEFKMQTDDFWKYHGALNVIVSGPDVPGEGEHKVMDFLRQQQQKHRRRRNHQEQPNNNGDEVENNKDDWLLYQPNYTHVLYGLDADLIMLGLVTHEPNFLLLREKMSVVMAGRGRNNRRRGGGRGGGGGESSNKKKDMLDYNENDFEVLELSGLRQMLALQFQKFLTNNNNNSNNKSSKEAFDLTRIVDDFVFMCMLVGNDFLPHAPHLEIDAGAISLMMSNYMDLLGESWGGGYLTHKERIHPQRLEEFIYCLAAYEEEHFKRRGYEENEPGWKLSAENEEEVDDFYGAFYSGEPTPVCAVPANVRKPVTGQGRFDGTGAIDEDEPAPQERPMEPPGNRSFRRKHPENLSRSYRDFYYDVKMGWKPNDRSRTLYRRRTHVRDYLEGLHWCLNYYHNGCPSWNWYFPYLYSPLCTDMVNLHEFYSDPDEHGYCSMKFDQGEPFPSLAQLLSVLPPQSADLLPNALAELMLHTSSPLKSFYPPEFTTDPNGKRQSWEAVVEIPFIDADVLLETVQQVLNADAQGKELLSNAERRRNLPGRDHVFRPNRDAAGQEQADQRSAAAATTTAAPATTSPAVKRRRAAPKQQ